MDNREHPGPGSIPTSDVLPRPATLAALVLLPVLLASMACTLPGFGWGSGTTVRLDSAPAASLRVFLRFDKALAPGQTTMVSVWLKTIQGMPVELTGGQRLAIDGVPLGP